MPDRILRTTANGKINLCLLLGQQRPDGYHDLVSVIQPLDLSDTVLMRDSESGSDEVHCPAVEGPNLVEHAISAWRAETGIAGNPVRVEIEKRIPVAAGMGGGSADAAAVLRLLDERFDADGSACASSLGADVPPLLRGGTTIVHGIGDRVEQVPLPEFGGVLILPSTAGLSTAVVFARAGEMGMRRSPEDLTSLRERIEISAAGGEGWQLADDLLGVNDLEPAAIALERLVAEAIAEANDAGADRAFATGSGPTVVALFGGADGADRARRAAKGLASRPGGAIFSKPAAGSATIEEVQ